MPVFEQCKDRMVNLRVTSLHVLEALSVQSPDENRCDELLIPFVQRIHLKNRTLTRVYNLVQRDVLFGVKQVVPLDRPAKMSLQRADSGVIRVVNLFHLVDEIIDSPGSTFPFLHRTPRC